MPSVSDKQHRLMEGIAHGMKPRGGHGPSVSVAREFAKADIGRFQSGGVVPDSMKENPRALPRFMRRNFYSGR